MRTASFFTDTGPGRIGIARWAPRGAPIGFRVHRPLNPTAPMLKMARAEYEPLYQAILARLDPRRVVEDLDRLADPHEPVLPCWERPPFTEDHGCHRRMVAAWPERELGRVVPEVERSPRPADGVGGRSERKTRETAMATSRIEWTEQTWNPVTGRAKVSPGCKHGYAERMAPRLQAMAAPGYARGFALTLQDDRLGQPLGRKKPTLYVVCSMADLFHEDVPDAFVDRVLATIHRTPWHTDQLPTQRAERLPRFFANRPVPNNVWLGVTVEDRRHGLPRIDHLRRVPARVRFLSVEPLLEDLGPLDLRGIDWVIVGGESGPEARPMREAGVLSARDRCRAAGVAFLFKRWGAWGPDGIRRDKKANGRLLAGRVWDERPESSGALL